jgi:hypothetical protein
LAEKLGMSIARIKEEVSEEEMNWWRAYFKVLEEENAWQRAHEYF